MHMAKVKVTRVYRRELGQLGDTTPPQQVSTSFAILTSQETVPFHMWSQRHHTAVSQPTSTHLRLLTVSMCVHV
jgi:hypothetical protein